MRKLRVEDLSVESFATTTVSARALAYPGEADSPLCAPTEPHNCPEQTSIG